MKANPGGQLAVEDIIGREEICTQIREILAQQSIIMTAERRIGKTSVMKILEEKPESNWVPIYIDLEKVENVKAFADLVCKEVHQYLSNGSRYQKHAEDLCRALGGIEAKGVKLPQLKEKTWQEILEASIRTLSREQQESGKQVLFLWDEFPYMVSNICDHDDQETAKNVLDTLRALRKDCENFRILITGSIGLHHVLGELQKSGYKNEPLNDMAPVEVQPLENEHAFDLARKLIAGEGIATDDIDLVTREIAIQTDNFPFYIQSVVRSLKNEKLTVTTEIVRKVILESLMSDDDPWELRHYDKRIKDYYPNQEELVRTILDILAVSETGYSPKQLLQIIKQTLSFDDIEKLRTLLRALNKDHYLTKDIKNQYTFRFSLIKKWWCLDRELV